MAKTDIHFIKKAIMISVVIAIYIVLTSTIIQYQQETKVLKLLYDTAKEWNPLQSDFASKVSKQEKILVKEVDRELSDRLSGKILLQIDQGGQGWYVYPKDKKKYFLGRPSDAYQVMKTLGLGVKKNNLENYLKNGFPEKLSGMIILDVEGFGEAYYVSPEDLAGYYLGRPDDALDAMIKFGLGISNEDLRKIDVGEIKLIN